MTVYLVVNDAGFVEAVWKKLNQATAHVRQLRSDDHLHENVRGYNVEPWRVLKKGDLK